MTAVGRMVVDNAGHEGWHEMIWQHVRDKN
jgi:hypothetical protein